MADTENDIPLNIWAEAVNSLFSDDLPESLFTLSEAEIAAVSRLHPHRWPSTGRACIKWDLTVQGRAFTFPPPSLRVLQPASHTAFTTDSLVLGRAAFFVRHLTRYGAPLIPGSLRAQYCILQRGTCLPRAFMRTRRRRVLLGGRDSPL